MSNTVPTASLPTDEASASGSQRRLLVVVGGAALLLVLGLGAYFLLLSGGEEEDLGPVPSSAPAPTQETGKKDKSEKKDDTVPTEVDKNFTVGRDPFLPLAAEQVVEVEAPAEERQDPVDDVGGTGGGQPDPAPAPAPTTKPTPAPTPTPTPTEDEVTYTVTLRSVDVAKESATIEVDGKRYIVKVKDMFTNSKTGPFKLTEVGERGSGKGTATVVFGSDAPVELVAKDTVVFTL
jgi:hypothetical protein